MSQFMLLIRNSGNPMEGMSDADRDAHMQAWGTWMGGLAQQGALEGGLPLSGDSAAILSDKGNTVSNGIYSQDGVSVGGYLLINADNLDAAVAISKGCPSFVSETSTVEVRECLAM